MAETANPSSAPGVPPPAPPAPATAPPTAPAAPTALSRFFQGFARLFTSTFLLVLGLGLIFVGILIRKFPHLVPVFLKSALDQIFQHLPYFPVGVGLFFLGWARSMALGGLIADYRKNRRFPHAWKIPLVGFQVFLLEAVCFIYALPVSLGWYLPIESLMAKVWVLFLGFVYGLWYVIAHSVNRLPAIARLRMAVVTLFLSFFAFFLWTVPQWVFPALLVGLLAIFALMAATLIQVKGVEQKGFWPHKVLLIISVIFLAHISYYVLPFGHPTADLLDLKLATEKIPGEVLNLNYFAAADHLKDEIAFAQNEKGEWSLGILAARLSRQYLLNPDASSQPVSTTLLKIQAGEEAFRPLLLENGSLVLADLSRNGERGLWKVDAATGRATLLRQGIEPIEDGVPWSKTRGEFLYVTHPGERYILNALTLANGKSRILMTSENPIHSPSWVRPLNPPHNPTGAYPEQQVSYADGIHGLFYVVDVKSGSQEPLKSEGEKSLGDKFTVQGKVREVIPAPDGFRYLYLSQDGNKTILWLVLADGTKRDPLYQTTAEVRGLAWNPNGQQVLFEEVRPGGASSWDLGFFTTVSTSRLLDANLGTCQYLIPPQISTGSPAMASDGVKVAFIAGEGLWYPSLGHGIWVATLR